MKKIILLLFFIFTSIKIVFSQEPTFINENELTQILERFIFMSKLPDHFYARAYAAKLVKEEGRDKYSVAFASICYAEELPKDSIAYIVVENKSVFLILNDKIVVYNSDSDKTFLLTNTNKIGKIADSLLVTGGVKYYPFIVILNVSKRNYFSNSRVVKFETYLPIKDVPKKYWPVSKPVSAIIDEPPSEAVYDIFGNEREEWKIKFKNGKGKFKIKTR